jgi:hypothetical protein
MYEHLAVSVHAERLTEAERSRLRAAARKLRRTDRMPPRPSRRVQQLCSAASATGLP